MVGDAAKGGGAAAEALALAPHRHNELLQADAVHALRQVRVPATCRIHMLDAAGVQQLARRRVRFDWYMMTWLSHAVGLKRAPHLEVAKFVFTRVPLHLRAATS